MRLQRDVEQAAGIQDKPTPRRLIDGALLNARIAIAYKTGESVEGFPLFHAPGAPTLRGAVEIGGCAGLKVEHKRVDVKRINTVTFETRVLVRVTGDIMDSAALSRDIAWGEEIAAGLAYRNAVQRILFEKGVKIES